MTESSYKIQAAHKYSAQDRFDHERKYKCDVLLDPMRRALLGLQVPFQELLHYGYRVRSGCGHTNPNPNGRLNRPSHPFSSPPRHLHGQCSSPFVRFVCSFLWCHVISDEETHFFTVVCYAGLEEPATHHPPLSSSQSMSNVACHLHCLSACMLDARHCIYLQLFLRPLPTSFSLAAQACRVSN